MYEVGLTQQESVVQLWLSWVDVPFVEVHLVLSDGDLLLAYKCKSITEAMDWCERWASQRRMIATAPPSYIDRLQREGYKDVTLNLYGPYEED